MDFRRDSFFGEGGAPLSASPRWTPPDRPCESFLLPPLLLDMASTGRSLAGRGRSVVGARSWGSVSGERRLLPTNLPILDR
eukprot:scaffold108068_cov63-Phaeocystis_antarctica.AAC.7